MRYCNQVSVHDELNKMRHPERRDLGPISPETRGVNVKSHHELNFNTEEL
jgi:hypothetical protein